MTKETKRTLRERLASLFRPEDEDTQDIHYNGKPMRRLLSYLKPHRKVFALCLCLVLALTALELAKPIIIGNAIDRYITGEKNEELQAEGREQWESGERAVCPYAKPDDALFRYHACGKDRDTPDE